MLLVIDGGNTNIVFGLRQDRTSFSTGAGHRCGFTVDYAMAGLSFRQSRYTFADITGVIISTVVLKPLLLCGVWLIVILMHLVIFWLQIS